MERGGGLAPRRTPPTRHLFPECVALVLAGGELLLPALHVGRGLLQRVHQPGVVLPQGLQLRLPLLGIGVTASAATLHTERKQSDRLAATVCCPLTRDLILQHLCLHKYFISDDVHHTLRRNLDERN